jgi:hypothetical protein
MRLRPRWRLSGLVLVTCLTAACGSTVQSSSGARSAVDADDRLGSELGAPSSEPADAARSAEGDGAGQAAAQGGRRATTGGGRVGSTGGPGAPLAKGAPVEVGIEYTDPASGAAFLGALGLDLDIGDGQAQAQAVIDHVNANGGLAGHPIRPVYYKLEPTRADPYATFMQEMCSMWTQDHSVVAAFAIANADFTPVASCLAKRRALFDNFAAWVRTQDDYGLSRYWVEPAMLLAERLANLYVDVPNQLGYFGSGSKVGLLIYDYPQSGRLARLVEASLKKRLGLSLTSQFTVHMGTSTPDLGSTISQIQSAVLRFRADGVNRVMSVAYPGAMTFFMRYADSQQYYPRYALTSPESLDAVAASVPHEQLRDAVAVGWLPNIDVGLAQQPPLNATGQRCRGIFKAAGPRRRRRASASITATSC